MDIYEELRSMEIELVDPEVRKSPMRLEELISEEFEEFGSSGRVIRKKDFLKGIEHDEPHGYILTDFSFTDLAADCVLVKYHSEISGVHAHRSSIWVNVTGSWQLIHHQSTVVPNAT